jgi:5'-nucleotidase (lipoprotein e(P4) family)
MKYVTVFLAFLLSCSSVKKTGSSVSGETGSSSGGTRHLVLDGKLWSSLFQQRAAEYKALCLQAFNIARVRLDEAIRQNTQAKPLAIISDIDETFLDNSPNSVHQALLGKDYEQAAWNEWTAKGAADTLPGALAFFNYAASLHITVFYITNRDEKDRPGTLNNLQKFHFPFSDNEHLIVRQTESSKEERRQKVMSAYQVVLLLGDNLGDFSKLFEKKTEAERAYNVNQLREEFGKRFIVLPNANYGGLEDAIYDNKRTWTLAQKDSIIKAKLIGY